MSITGSPVRGVSRDRTAARPDAPEGEIAMSTRTVPTATATVTCDPATRVTKSLLGYGVVAGPLYVAVSLGQALTRPGFDLTRHQWSLLSNGGLGWIQITNFLLTGAMIVACAVGMRRALARGRGARWAPRLVATFGASLVAAGVFRADPALGFPAGAPAGPGQVSWHGALHLLSAGIGFTCVAVACLVVAGRLAADGHRGLAAASRVSGVAFLVSFGAVASSGGAPWGTLCFVGGVLVIFAWLTVTSVHLYRRAAH